MPLTEELITLLEAEIPGYNRRPLGVEDLERVCEASGVVLLFCPLPGHGLCFRRHGVPVIAVSKRLRGAHRVFVGFHEYFHYRFHPGTIHTYSASNHWLKKIELQASILAALAVLPTPGLEEYLAAGEDLIHISSLPTDVVRFRLKVHQEYQDLLTARQGV